MTPGKSYNIPPIWNFQSSEWTLHFSMQSMRAHAKQSTNRKISGNVSVTPQLIGRYKEMSVWHQVNLPIYPPIYLTEHWVMSSLFNVVIGTQRQIYPLLLHWQTTEWSLHCSKLSLRLKGRYTPQSCKQQISLIARSTTMHIYIGGR